jgi:peptidoglycan/xylan/chitin deacetylase (PgdA/CDA1 family)
VEELATLPETIMQVRTQYGEKIRLLEEKIMAGETDIRICYLTLDDGPNNMTGKIVEKMDELDIYATFFTIGSNGTPNQTQNLRLEMMGGHTVAHGMLHRIDANTCGDGVELADLGIVHIVLCEEIGVRPDMAVVDDAAVTQLHIGAEGGVIDNAGGVDQGVVFS